MSHTAYISRVSPTRLRPLVEQSGSMVERFGMYSSTTKAQGVADVINRAFEVPIYAQLFRIPTPFASAVLRQAQILETSLEPLLAPPENSDHLASWIERLRDAGRLHNDDVTLSAAEL